MLNIKSSKNLFILIISLLIALTFWGKVRYDRIFEKRKAQIQNCQKDLEQDYLNFSGVIVQDKNNFNILVDTKDDIVSKCIIKYKYWEEHFQNALKHLVKPNDRVLIFGAHIGYHAVLIGKLIGDNGKMWIFEANPYTVKFLKANLIFNDINNGIVYPKAVYRENTKLEFKQIVNGNTGMSRIGEFFDDSLQYRKIQVEAVNVDSLPQISDVNVIQMDIEGGEPDAIYGAKDLIDNSKNLIVFQEWDTSMTKGIDDYLHFWRSRGYRAAQINDKSLTELSDDELKKPNIHIDILWAKNLDDIIAKYKSF
jgi:FkbM family methyltransferase